MRWSILVSFAFCLPFISTQPASATRLSTIVQRTMEKAEMRLKVNQALRQGGVHKVLRNKKWTGDKLFCELAEGKVTHGIKGLTRELQQQVDWLFKRADTIKDQGQTFNFYQGATHIGELKVSTKKLCMGRGYDRQGHISLRSTDDHSLAVNFDFRYQKYGSVSKTVSIKAWQPGDKESAFSRSEVQWNRRTYNSKYKWDPFITGEVQEKNQHLSYTAKDGVVRPN